MKPKSLEIFIPGPAGPGIKISKLFGFISDNDYYF